MGVGDTDLFDVPAPDPDAGVGGVAARIGGCPIMAARAIEPLPTPRRGAPPDTLFLLAVAGTGCGGGGCTGRCCGSSNPCCGNSDPCCGSSNPCCGNPDPCCGNPDRCCNADNPCCGSSDPCCNSGDRCCGNPDRCCNSDNPCCHSTNACCNSSDPCCGNSNRCCNSDNPCCHSTSNGCGGTSDPCYGNPDPCCHPDNPCCGNTNPCDPVCGNPCLCLNCDDGDPCTIDSCASGSCRHVPKCVKNCCPPDWHCCDGPCCGGGCCLPEPNLESCCNEALVVCCGVDPPSGTGFEAYCINECCATGLVCCGTTNPTCCDPERCCDDICCGGTTSTAGAETCPSVALTVTGIRFANSGGILYWPTGAVLSPPPGGWHYDADAGGARYPARYPFNGQAGDKPVLDVRVRVTDNKTCGAVRFRARMGSAILGVCPSNQSPIASAFSGQGFNHGDGCDHWQLAA